MKRVLPDVAIAVGCVLLLLGSVAGVVNRQVLDGPRFADHVESIRTDPDVTRELGRAITARVLVLDPDLVAVRPLVESVATVLAGSPALRPVVTRAARELHAALTSPSSAPIVLQLADVGAVLTASLRVAAPDLAASLPATFDVTLARIGSGSFADSTARFAHHVELLAWLLPLIGLLLIGIGIATSRDRPAAGARAGFGVIAAGVVLGSVALALGIVADSLARALRPALRADRRRLASAGRPDLVDVRCSRRVWSCRRPRLRSARGAGRGRGRAQDLAVTGHHDDTCRARRPGRAPRCCRRRVVGTAGAGAAARRGNRRSGASPARCRRPACRAIGGC